MNRKVLLIEPNYKNKYPPMGLMKIATYYKRLNDDVRFYKGDLKQLIVSLLSEDTIKVLNASLSETSWGRYAANISSFIRYGKYSIIDSVPVFDNKYARDVIKLYRDKFKSGEAFSEKRFDIVCVTTLFTFHWDITIDTINFAKKLCKDPQRVFVGGIAASIVPSEMTQATEIHPIQGILNKPGMLLDDNDIIIDTLPLDYSILEEIDYEYPSANNYIAYMTRGCVNKCTFCAVPKLEPEYVKYIPLKKQLAETDKRFGKLGDLLLLDNNVLASPRFSKIIDEIKACGFAKGASYIPPNPFTIAIQNLRDGINDRGYIIKCVKLINRLIDKCEKPSICKDIDLRNELYKRVYDAGCDDIYTATKESLLSLADYIAPIYERFAYKPVKRSRYIDFNQGIDARLITPQNMQKLAEINIRPLRIAFDHWGLHRVYERAVRYAAEAGISHLSNYMLYNYDEEPVDLYRRMRMTVDLADELNIKIYSFPMKYHPIDDPRYFRNREYIGTHWNRKYIRAVQAVLTSTHGKIGNGRQFFEAAFGADEDEYIEILQMPEAFIISRFENDSRMRDRYPEYSKDEYDGTATDEWRSHFYALDDIQKARALDIIKSNHFDISEVEDQDIKSVIGYYAIHRTR